MSDLLLGFEPLNRVLDGNEISINESYEVFDRSSSNPSEIYAVSAALRNKHKKRHVTFSKKSFFNLVNLCRDTCGYCTYKSEPGQAKLSLMSKKDVQDLARIAKKFRCTEALFVTGERPEEKYQEARTWLRDNGFSTTAEYLVHASEIALDEGLFPHTNAGNLTKSEINELKKTNVSLGLMLENASERLREKDLPHSLAPSKDPKARIAVLESAGELNVPMTTGLLVGIGETPHEIIDSLFAIRKIHEKFGNIQEVILQNFQPKHDTRMRNSASAEENYFKTIVALARIIMPEMNVQIPPNLSPKSYQTFIETGINDWGGISPITQDYVNPEFEWPKIETVEENTNRAGFDMKARFPVYPEFMRSVNSDLFERMSEIMDAEGLVREEYWR